MTRFPVLFSGLIAAGLAASPAAAHLDPVAHGSFAAGATHPLFGADHVLAMLAVGLWAASLGGRALLALPAGFVGAMALGFVLALGGLTLPLVEPVILASVLALGGVVALAARVALPVAVVICAGFGLFHGQAHGVAIGGAAALAYLAGFTLATAALHAGGVALGLGLARVARATMTRAAGAGVVVLGGFLALGV